jgi:L-threonylcarbamoyladenylate synthase
MISNATITGKNIDEAIKHLEQNEVVGIPTETVYGLGANAFSEKAIQKVFAVKKRPYSNPLIVHVDRIAEVKQLVRDVPDTAEALLESFSPGPLTLLLKKNSLISNLVTAGRFEVAIRIPSHPLTLELLRRVDFPLVAPSANLFTTISPTHPTHVVKNFFGKIPYVLDGGACPVGIESTVVGFEKDGTPVIYRQGAISAEEVKLVTGKVRMKNSSGTGISPGTHLHHYAPYTPLFLVDKFYPLKNYSLSRTGVLCFNRFYKDLPLVNQFVLSATGKLEEAARNLYKGLHYLDEQKLDVIVAEVCPDIGIGKAINDRLRRAAHIFKPKFYNEHSGI